MEEKTWWELEEAEFVDEHDHTALFNAMVSLDQDGDPQALVRFFQGCRGSIKPAVAHAIGRKLAEIFSGEPFPASEPFLRVDQFKLTIEPPTKRGPKHDPKTAAKAFAAAKEYWKRFNACDPKRRKESAIFNEIRTGPLKTAIHLREQMDKIHSLK
jgi:hypothetical protein